MNLIDVQPLLTPVFTVVGLLIAGYIARAVPKALDLFEGTTAIKLTDQQRATILGAVKTAAGEIAFFFSATEICPRS